MAGPELDYKGESNRRHAYRMEGLADDYASGRIDAATYVERVETMARLMNCPLPADWQERVSSIKANGKKNI